MDDFDDDFEDEETKTRPRNSGVRRVGLGPIARGIGRSGPQPEFEPPTRIGEWEIGFPIGEGATSNVYLVRHASTGKFGAMKICVRVESEPTVLERFVGEARILERIDHRNVVRLFDQGFLGELPWMVMEYAPLGTLWQHGPHDGSLRGKVEPKQVLLFGADLCHGLAAAHSIGAVHRDLKPQNALVMGDGRVALCDFGIAKLPPGARDNELTDQFQLLGTVEFFAPEQWRPERAAEVGPRSDIFSAGLVLLLLATGDPKLLWWATTRPPAVLPRDGRLDSLSPIIQRATEKDPADRYESALEMAEALERAVREMH